MAWTYPVFEFIFVNITDDIFSGVFRFNYVTKQSTRQVAPIRSYRSLLTRPLQRFDGES
jgi:hypothetical protein